MATTKKIRAWVMLDPKTYKEIQGYAKDAGVSVPQYLNLSSILGARILSRITSSEDMKLVPNETLSRILDRANFQ